MKNIDYIDFSILKEIYLSKEDDYIAYSEVDRIKNILRDLPEYEQMLIIYYAHYNSLRVVGELMGMSHTKVAYELERVRQRFRRK